MEIHVATPADSARLAGLIAGFRDHLRAAAPSDATLAAALPAALADPSLEFCCARLGARDLGYTQTRFLYSVWSGGTDAHLEDLFVVPSARGKRLGRALLRHALERARARGALRFTLTTNEGNAAAQALYRSEGLAPQSHALYPDGREVVWVRELG